MAVVLRLSRHGQTKRPFYRLVATEKTSRRDGRFIEIVGYLNPLTEPPTLSLKEDRIRRWISYGAKASGTARELLKKAFPNMIEERENSKRRKLQANRRVRKERARKIAKA